MEWIHLEQDKIQWRALFNTAIKLRVPQKAGNLPRGLWRRTPLHGVGIFIHSFIANIRILIIGLCM